MKVDHIDVHTIDVYTIDVYTKYLCIVTIMFHVLNFCRKPETSSCLLGDILGAHCRPVECCILCMQDEREIHEITQHYRHRSHSFSERVM